MNREELLKTCISLKPKELIISDLRWRYLIWAILYQKNILIVGESGTAKTLAARCAAKALNLSMEIISCGSSQDARATLIGNTTFQKSSGTIFNKSIFVKAITAKNTVILLDELSRGTHDAINILMPVLDPTQRTLRLDEDENSTLVKVADGVTFIATSNVGNLYTATNVIDKAILRRFPIKLEMPMLSGDELYQLFSILYPLSPEHEKIARILTNISDDLVAQCNMEDAKISTCISPANMAEMCSLILHGFSLVEIAEAAIYPEYEDSGGADSERSFVKEILQKHFPKNVKSPINDPLKSKKKATF